jgi:hypothetical protein
MTSKDSSLDVDQHQVGEPKLADAVCDLPDLVEWLRALRSCDSLRRTRS